MRLPRFVLLSTLAYAAPTLPAAPAHRTIYQFPNPTWLENIASTRSGALLVGIVGQDIAQLHIVDPLLNATQNTLLHTFPDRNAVFGISEYAPDIFAVAVSNFSLATLKGTGDTEIWSVDISCQSDVKVSKLAYLPDTEINGLAALSNKTLLFTDSTVGYIGNVDVKTGAYEIVLQDATTTNNMSAPVAFGANGIKVIPSAVSSEKPEYTIVYFSNLQLGAAFKVQVDGQTGRPSGAVVTLAEGLGVVDDLAVTDKGVVFVTRDYENDIVSIGADGEVSVVAKGVKGPTAAVLGTRKGEEEVLYASTMGGEKSDGTFEEGGKIVAIDVGVEECGGS